MTKDVIATPAEQSLSIIEKAVAAGMKTEDLEVLYRLHTDAQDRQARADFAEALASFQQECPPITKNASSKQATGGGSGYAYRYATLDHIERTVKPLLVKRGLSYTFDSELREGMVKVICTLRGLGHEISASFTSPIDKGGRMNLIQQHATSLSYARRYALTQVLGLSSTDSTDTDGVPLTAPAQEAKVTDKQVAELDEMVEASGSDRGKLLAYFEVASFDAMTESKYRMAMNMMKRKMGDE